MRGSPLLQALLLTVVLALAGLPVWLLTRPHAHAEPAGTAKAKTAAVATELTVTSTANAEVELSHSGTMIWRGQPAANRFETALSLPPDAELVAHVRWTSGGANAIRFQISRDGESRADATLWGDGETTDVLAISSSPPPPAP